MSVVKVLYITIVLILFCGLAFGYDDIFIVDNGTIETDDNTSWSGVDGAAYTTDTFPSGAVGYNSIEDIYNSGSGVTGLGPGDRIYLRQGTYDEDYGTGTAMILPFSVDGTGWGDNERILFASYPGEWAVISSTSGDQCAIGLRGTGDTQATADNAIPEYWQIERLEITSTSTSSSAHGLGIHGGPWKLRYLYVHDIPSGVPDTEENPGGIRGYCWRNGSIIEYSYIKDIAASTDHWNSGAITVFSDYSYDDDSTPRDNWVIDESRENYIVRYCRIEGTTVLVKEKALQMLKTSASDYTYETHYPNIHHNLLIGDGSCCSGTGGAYGVEVDTDFAQVHHNIFDGCNLQYKLNRGGVTNVDVLMYDLTAYNNTIIGAQLSFGVGYAEDPGTSRDPKAYAYNNIITGFGNDTYGPSIGFFTQACYGGNCDSAMADCTPNWTTSVIDRNLIHDPQYADHINEMYSRGISARWYTVSEFNSYQSVTNYTNATSGLFLGSSGADQYITDGTFVVDGNTTIADGGIDTTHPYLSGVDLPAFVGATNPDDYAWVDGVLNDVNSTTWLRSTSTDRDGDDNPTWIEGAAAASTGSTMGQGVNISGGGVSFQ